MSDSQRWDNVFGQMDDIHWDFYSDIWITYLPLYQNFDLMNIGGGPL